VARTVTNGVGSVQPKNDEILLSMPGFSVWATAACGFGILVAPEIENQFGTCMYGWVGSVYLGFGSATPFLRPEFEEAL
jgi:hypothetical protein